MTNILAQKIQSIKLTKTQQKIAEYFMQNQEQIGSLSSVEVAEKIGVSDASIIRFARAIGYDGYSDLKDHIYNTLVEDAFSALSLSERMTQSIEQYSESEISGQFLRLMQNNLLYSFLKNDEAKFHDVAKSVISARKKYIIGQRGCRGIVMQFSRLLSFMVSDVICIIDDECFSLSAAQSITADDVILMYVFKRYYKSDLAYLKLAKERGAKICLVIDDMANALTPYADIILLVETNRMSFFNSTIGVNMISEYILTLISRHVEFKERIEKRDEITKDQRL